MNCVLTQVIIISDTFTQFAKPLMKKLGWPTLFCNSLEVAEDGTITGFKMRIENSKLTTVKALQSAGFDTIAAGDSFNDQSKPGRIFVPYYRPDQKGLPGTESI